MFERFSERARQVLILAQDEARELRHNYIGTEHLLLGLIREEQGLAARVLAQLGVTLAAVRAHVEPGEGAGKTIGQIPFTRRAKQSLDGAVREALKMGHRWIGTEHLLLGLVSDADSTASLVLGKLGVSPERTRDAVLRFLSGTAE